MNFIEIINMFITFAREKGFTAKDPIGLLSPTFPHEFNVSAGHDYAREIFEANQPIVLPIKYSLIDTSFRRIDMQHIGFSDHHLSLFHIALFSCGVTKEKIHIHINELVSNFIQFLIEILEISKDKLLITVFNGGRILNFNLNREDSLIKALIEGGIPESRILPLEGRRNFFLAQNVECSGPTCEVYFDRGDKSEYSSRFIEIGSMNFYKYIYNSKKDFLDTPLNQIFVCAIGIERTLMALQNKPTIFDIDIISPLINVINKYLSSPFENDIFSNSIKSIVDCVRSAIFILSEGINPDNSSRGRILQKLIKSIANQMKYLHLFDFKILDELQNKTTEIYAEFYPKIKPRKVDLRLLISNRFETKKER